MLGFCDVCEVKGCSFTTVSHRFRPTVGSSVEHDVHIDDEEYVIEQH